MVMTCRHAPSQAHRVLLVLLFVTPQLAGAAPAWGEGGEGGAEEGRTRTDPGDSGLGAVLSLPHPVSSPPTALLHLLLEALDRPGAGAGSRGQMEDRPPEGSRWGGGGGTGTGTGEPAGGPGGEKVGEQIPAPHGDALQEGEELEDHGEEGGLFMGETGFTVHAGSEEGQRGGELDERNDSVGLSHRLISGSAGEDSPLQRKIRGYFQNIDLGLQDNEILPPLKGYKAYNTELARAGKKQRWQGEQASNRPLQGGNFMDDFENEGEELEEVEKEEEESFSQMEEETRARAEQREVLRQQGEAERAREEEQRLADIASDMLLKYMGRKEPASYAKPRQKSATAEDKRSEEVVSDDDEDMDQQMIDRLIEISSKLHLPADDVVEIISDVEEKKKKRKELQQLSLNVEPVNPRFRPLVPPPLAAPPIYHYTASTNPKKAPYKYRSNKKWQKEKVKAYKQDFWYRPQKQFLAFPSYPYYQKPYRAYYPVYFPYPKHHYYGKMSPSMDQSFGPQEPDFQAPRRRFRGGGKGRGKGWRQLPPPRMALPPYISNYILPHPRTYQPPLPPLKPPVAPARRGRRPAYLYPQAALGDDYEEDELVPQLDSEEELENFIERIYMKRRMY